MKTCHGTMDTTGAALTVRKWKVRHLRTLRRGATWDVSACWTNAVGRSNDVPASAHAAADELSRRRAGRHSRAERLGTLSQAGSIASTPVALQKSELAVHPGNAVAAHAMVDSREAWPRSTRRHHSREGRWSLFQQRQPRLCRCCMVPSLVYSGRRCDDAAMGLQLNAMSGARRSNGTRARACVWLGRGVLVGRQQAAGRSRRHGLLSSKGTKP